MLKNIFQILLVHVSNVLSGGPVIFLLDANVNYLDAVGVSPKH